MTEQQIQQLLERFLAAETTEQEESLLKDYFLSHEDIPAEWQAYRVMFLGFTSKPAPQPVRVHTRIVWAAGVAACVAAILAVILQPPRVSDTGEKTVATTKAVAPCPDSLKPEVIPAVAPSPVLASYTEAEEYDQSDLVSVQEMFDSKDDPLADFDNLHRKLKAECERAFSKKEFAYNENDTIL